MLLGGFVDGTRVVLADIGRFLAPDPAFINLYLLGDLLHKQLGPFKLCLGHLELDVGIGDSLSFRVNTAPETFGNVLGLFVEVVD